MKATIIIPVYNTALYLRECLDSVINQKTEYSYEIIAVNDGSTDNSLNILTEYQDKIKIINKQNTGPGDSRNIAIKEALGEYLLFVDSDDYVSAFFVQTMIANIIKYEADIVICDFYRVKNEEKKLTSKGDFAIYQKGMINDVLLMEFHSCNKIFKKDLLINKSYPQNMLFEDVVAVSMAELKANKIVKIEEALYFYRTNTSSITNIINNTNYDLKKALDMVEKDFLKAGYKEEIEFLYANGVLVDLLIKLFKKNGGKAIKEAKVIQKEVLTKYPNIYKNKFLKKVKLMKKLYLFCLKYNVYFLISLMYNKKSENNGKNM